jgi:prepilin peptidase dependent protein B
MKKQSGFTLIEIMIALLIGLLIVAATISIYITTIRGSSDTIRSARLNHDLDSAMSLMINDIRRAGYWGGAIAGADSRNTPTNPGNLFTTATTNIQIPSSNCILYTYDANGGSAVDSNEYYGFKLEGTNIRMRKTGTTTADCTDGVWETMNIDTGNSRSEKVEIDALTFDFDDASAPSKCKNVTTATIPNFEDKSCATLTTLTLNSGDDIVETRQVTITLRGHITGETSVQKSQLSNVKVRNDRVFTQP